MITLYAPEGYEPKQDCNGCGTGWNSKLVPDTIYWVSITPACCIHDYMYSVGKTNEDKCVADRVFLNNMLRIIESVTEWYYPTALARRRALKYYEAVVSFGSTAYWEGKNESSNLINFNTDAV